MRTQKKIVTFVLLTFAISSISYYVMIRTGTARSVALWWMWTPAMAAILTQLLFRESLREFGWRPGRARYLLLGAVIPLLYAVVIHGTAWVTGLGRFRMQSPVRLLVFATVGFVVACWAALGEEIGWRGFLVPEVAKITTFTRTALASGIIWAVWHYPAVIFADYSSGASVWFDLFTLTMGVMGMSFFVAWLRLKSGSIWPAVLWHGAHNLFIQQIFLDMTTDTGVTRYVVDDFGLGVLLSVLILGYIFWRKRSELPDAQLSETLEVYGERRLQSENLKT
ncbi:MAG: CPBP family intramembrane metalloprotease [Anaerolineae bacterium]|nr:CPBP family intramembrane metalloprotease [Anaerolineae bacterium]NIN94430.1 CPBP family intramembrane metalloprotease [Anaerolineae bacterium]NIQ77493.1 CPBP family intramembrane metalloprotease [Anaerolineae bacterium]